ncbi:MFS transporter [Scytonema sp. UIC 10036]|uniref:MFS transporter n=1 Tax=Scytonema sp. UIC 10036 TaxID=2304196 RepID=UPI0012DA2833|nr:MFS transporter [Scytonema sp. UIC 10036]MUG99128.1 MFS transporter [Scytonema sp. UIC 10036]
MNKPNSNSNSTFTKAALLLASTLTVMSGATIAPSLPAMQDHFVNVANVELLVKLVITMPALFIVIGSPIAGMIVDRFGRKPLLLSTTLFYGLTGASGLILDSLPAILVGRAFLGLSVSGVMVSATTLIADYYIGTARTTFMGLQAAFMSLGGVLFLSLGGTLALHNWRYPFLIYLFSLLLLPLIVFAIYEPQRNLSKKILASNQGSQNESIPITLLLLIFGMTTLSQIIFYLIPVQLPFYLRSLVNATPSESGMAIAFCTLFSAFTSIFYGRIKAKLDFVSIVPFTFGIFGIGYVIIGHANNYPTALVGLAIAGLGLGLLMPNMSVWISTIVPDAVRGRSLGGLSTAFFLGQFLSPIIAQPVSQKVGLALTYGLAGGLLLLLSAMFIIMRAQVTALSVKPIKSEKL